MQSGKSIVISCRGWLRKHALGQRDRTGFKLIDERFRLGKSNTGPFAIQSHGFDLATRAQGIANPFGGLVRNGIGYRDDSQGRGSFAKRPGSCIWGNDTSSQIVA
jgi:hypothetical protein